MFKNPLSNLSPRQRKLFIIAGIALAALILILVSSLLLRSCSSGGKYGKLYDRASASYERGDYDKALGYIDDALDAKQTEEAYLLKAEIYYKGLDDIDKAIDTLYVAFVELGTDAISTRLEELKTIKAQGEGPGEDELIIGTKTVKKTETTLVLSQLRLTDADIEPLSQLTELQNLTLSDNSLTSLTPLSGLTKLTFLQLSNNRIADLTPLRGLTGLTILYLDGNPITDFTPLESLKNLTMLSIKNVTVTVEQLDALTKALPGCSIYADEAKPVEIKMGSITFMSDVTELDLSAQGISDLTPLAKCTKLTKLNVSQNAVRDLKPLSGLTELSWLCIWDNDVSDLSPLVGLTKLVYIDADDNSVSSLAPLASMPQLQEVWFSRCPLSSVSTLSSLPSLRSLGLKSTGLEDSDLDVIMKLKNLTQLLLDGNTDVTGEKVDELKKALPNCTVSAPDCLYSITLGGTKYKSDATTISATWASITNLAGLEHFTKLEALDFTANGIRDLTPLKGLTALQSLSLENNSIVDLAPLKGLTGLKSLNLIANEITDISPLSSLTGLTSLELGQNTLSSLSPLSSLTGLAHLTLNHCSVSDLSALSGLTKLTYLNLEGNSITDATPLKSLTGLKNLYIGTNGLSADQLRELQAALPNCVINTDVDLTTPTPSPSPTPTPAHTESPSPSPAPGGEPSTPA